MPGPIAKADIVKAIIQGIAKSQKDYEEWSGGDWLNLAPEYLITTYVARQIAKLKGQNFITLEHGTENAMAEANATSRGRVPRKLRNNGRVDILLWYANGSPRAAIEIKNQALTTSRIKPDLDRLKHILKRNFDESSFQFAALGYYISSKGNHTRSAKDRLETRLEVNFKHAKEIMGVEYRVTAAKRIKIVDESAWAASCLVMSRIKAK